jgi:prevent-host-death family protein
MKPKSARWSKEIAGSRDDKSLIFAGLFYQAAIAKFHFVMRGIIVANQILSDTLREMKILSVTQAARHFREVIESLERDHEEIILVRNGKPVARLVPETPPQNALEVFGDLYRPQVRSSRSAR